MQDHVQDNAVSGVYLREIINFLLSGSAHEFDSVESNCPFFFFFS